MRRLWRVCLCLASALALLGQDAPLPQRSPNLETYESFFLAVSQLAPGKAVGRAVGNDGVLALNGQRTNLVQPGLQDAMGITVEEALALRAIAVDYQARRAVIHDALKPLVMELRFAALADEAPPQSVRRQYDELNRQLTEMVREHVQELRNAFGEARFPLIEAFLSARKNSGSNSASFFPAVPQVAKVN